MFGLKKKPSGWGQSLEGCMASSITQAREGTLYLMCGGKQEVFERAKTNPRKKLSASMRYIGPAGKAAEVKALVNMVMTSTPLTGRGPGPGCRPGARPDDSPRSLSQTGANSPRAPD